MKENRKKPVSLQEKIDIFTRYFAEGNETINGKTVFEGHPIGDWAIQIRSDINSNRGNIKPDLKQLKQLFKLGILESQRDSTIDEKIDALVEWTAKHPDITIETRMQRDISYTTQNQLKELAAEENVPYDEILKRYEKLQGYREYVWHRESKGRLTKAQISKCKEGGLGGKFGLPSVIENMAAKYNIDVELAEHIYKNYGSVEEVINKYRNGELSEEEKYRFVGTLFNPWIDIDNSPTRKAYEQLILAIFRIRDCEEDIHLYSSKNIEKALSSLEPRQQTLIRERFGLDGEDTKTLKNIAGAFDLTSTRIRQIEAKALRILRHPTRARIIKPVEFNSFKNNPYITEEEKVKLINLEDELWSTDAIISSTDQSDIPKFDYSQLSILTELSREFEHRKQKAVSTRDVRAFEDITIEELDLSVRAYNTLKRAGKDTVKDLLEMNQEGFINVRNMGKKSMYEIIAKIEEYGYTFDAETGFKKVESKENIQEPLIEETLEGSTKNEIDIESGDIGIRDIYGLTPKTYDILEREGITSLQKLTSMNVNQISSISNLRSDSIRKLISRLQEMGYAVDEKGNFVCEESEEKQLSQSPKELESVSLADMRFADNMYMDLKQYGITSLQDLVNLNEKRLRSIKGIGNINYDIVVAKMREYGYELDKKGRFVYSVPEEEKVEQVIHEAETIETVEQNIEEPQDEKRSESNILQEMKARREQLEQQLAVLEEQARQAKELLAEYDKIIGEGKTHTEDETPDFKDE